MVRERVAKFGAVKRVFVMESRIKGGLVAAFVTMASAADATRVIGALHGTKFDETHGMALIVRHANPPRGVFGSWTKATSGGAARTPPMRPPPARTTRR